MCIDLELATKIGAFLVALAVFIKGIYEYTKAQRWKKAEFVAKEIKDFLSDIDVKRALLLLDWSVNDIVLRENEIENKLKLEFDDKLILSSLKTHEESAAFSDEEVLIKAAFDSFFDKLIMFHNYIKAGLVEPEDIKPYLIYWIKIFADSQSERKSEVLKKQMWKYIDFYGYSELRFFCKKFGFEITY